MTRCHDVRPYLEAFVDDELSTERFLEVEQHLTHCLSCLEHTELARALKRTTRDVVLVDARPSGEFLARLSVVIDEECRREEVRRPTLRPLSWRFVAPLALAAGAVLAFGAYRGLESSPFAFPGSLPLSPSGALQTPATQASLAPDALVDELVRYHAAPTAPEVTDDKGLARLEAHVGVPMHAPELTRYGARFLGASVVAVDDHRAAQLRYTVAGHRVTVYVYNPRWVPVRGLPALQPRVFGDRAVFVGHHNGYSIAALEQRGVGYAIATDLGDRESVELLAAIR